MRKAALLPHQVEILKRLKEQDKYHDNGHFAYFHNRDLIIKNFWHDAFFVAWYSGYEEVQENQPLILF